MNCRRVVVVAVSVVLSLLVPAVALGFTTTQTGSLSKSATTDLLNFDFTNLPPAAGPVSVEVGVRGDLDNPVMDFALYSVEGSYLGNICHRNGGGCRHCGSVFHTKTTSHPSTVVDDGQLTVGVRKYYGVEECSPTFEARVTVSYQTRPTVAGDIQLTTPEDTPVSPKLKGSDPEGDPLTYRVVDGPDHGSVSVTGDRATYTPQTDWCGVDHFDYVADDGTTQSNKATVSINVTHVNDAPEWMTPPTPKGTVKGASGTSMTFTIKARDIDGPSLEYSLGAAPAGATVGKTDGKFRWSPGLKQSGAHKLELKATDTKATITRTVTLLVDVVDSDGDGIPDGIETDLGLDPDSKDSDGDTISDGDEIGGDLQNPRDTDGDGTIDALDLDSDDDGVLDAREAGDADLSTPPVDTDGDGLADYRDPDSDGDGVADGSDNCRLDANPMQSDADGDGIGNACDDDDDGDGVDDSLDQCPMTVGRSANNGCPATGDAGSGSGGDAGLDGGISADGGSPPDAGADTGSRSDGGVAADAGGSSDTGEEFDSGPTSDGDVGPDGGWTPPDGSASGSRVNPVDLEDGGVDSGCGCRTGGESTPVLPVFAALLAVSMILWVRQRAQYG